MNITLAIPKGKECKHKIEQELSLARNIQDKNVKNNIINGINKILKNYSDGKIFLWNGLKLVIFDYPLNQYIYYCGNEFVIPEHTINNSYLMVVMDANEASIAILNGKSVKLLWSEESNVPRKHSKGGQSKARFQREREECKKRWFKKVAEKIKELSKKSSIS